MQRQRLIEAWLGELRPGRSFALAPASADASFRRYFRAVLDDGSTCIVMDAPPDREDVRPWLRVQSLFQSAGVHVPEVLAADMEQGFLLLSDLGSTTYLAALQTRDRQGIAQQLYPDAIDALIRIQLARPDGKLLSGETYNQVYTMHGVTMIFLAAMPLAAAFGNYLIPLQIGARDVAFPRLNALSFWIFLAGGLFLNSSWLLGGGADGGWFNYAPNSGLPFSPGHGIDFYALGLQITGFASLIGAINLIVTIINLRSPGMLLFRMPVFTWMMLVVQFLLVFAMPVISIALFLLTFDRLFGANFFNTAAGADPLLWQHLFWNFGHPEVYILVLPAFGIVSEIIPVFSRKPLFGYSVMVYAIAAICLLYVHPRKRYDGHVFVAFLVLYGVARFLLEILRRDDRGGVAWFSTSQWISVGLIAAAVAIHRARSPRVSDST